MKATAGADRNRGRARSLRRLASAIAVFLAADAVAARDARTPLLEGDSGEPLCFPSDTGAPILGSIYSLPAPFISADDAEHLLDAVAELSPERQVVVLTDLSLSPAPGRHLIATRSRDFSPWPRDPFSLAREADGGVRVVVRPNRQRGREADAALGATLLDGLPPALRAEWREPRSSTAPVPFHNGQLLLDRDALWLSIHSVEPRALELLGLARVPVASFAEPAGATRYADAARRAAAELGELYGRPARFVHPLPSGADDDPTLTEQLGGGAGFDLDSLLTLLRLDDEGPLTALVGDVTLGAKSLPPPDDPSWETFRRAYGVAAGSAAIHATLAATHPGSRADRLDRFLDLVAGHLSAQGLTVERLPIWLVPVALLGRPELLHPDFVLGWNNVVVERRADGSLRAEGFASGLAPLDLEAERRFAAAGAHLLLLPPFVESVVRNGGYRCASNHLRVADCPPPTARPSGADSRNR